ncbi:hypothetical protein EC968_008617 [Mortierella alpina]|nr:hypothetical protein EC968_008617 [Mortierella alpina]
MVQDPLAYSKLAFRMAARAAKYTGYYLARKTPKAQPYWIGVNVAMLYPAVECLSVRQYRAFMSTALSLVEWRAGLGSEVKRAQWAVPTRGEGWHGYWIPFQDQKNASTVIGDIPLGTGCDIVVLASHGGGFMTGHALMFLNYFKKWMKSAQENHNVRIGIVSVEYGLSPENPFPVAMNEITAAYKDLVQTHGVEAGRIVLSLGTTLLLRDEYSELGSPAGHILVCPWVRSPEPPQNSLYDVVSEIGCQVYAEAYTQNKPESDMCAYTSPFSAPTLARLSPMLIFIGGVEILRPSIEQFVEKAKKDGVEVKTVVGEERAHNYFLLDDISTKKDRQEAYCAMSEFVSDVHRRFKPT